MSPVNLPVSIIAVTSVLIILHFAKHVNGSVTYLTPATYSESYVLKPIEQADGSFAYEITSTSSFKPRKTKKEKATANSSRPNKPSGASNDQKAQPANSANAAAALSTASSVRTNYEDPVLPSLLTDEPYISSGDFVWPAKLPSKYPKRPKPVTSSSAGLPLRLPSILPSEFDSTEPAASVTGSTSSPISGTASTAPAISGTGSSGVDTLPQLTDLSADSIQTQTPATSLAETLPPATSPAETLPPATSPSENLPPATSPAETLPPASSPAETLPPATSPAETLPPASSPAETLPPASSPAETLPLATSPAETLLPQLPSLTS